ncbi:MAG: putative transcriptional regulator YvhJ [Microgenomates bacterium OLB23]|nr:MAG: putative transcriptional regulator YvhJ [Microgenomates bacterium OLB23]
MNVEKRKKVAIGITLAIVLLLIFGIFRVFRLFTSINTESSIWGSPIPKEKKIFSLLVMGYGGAGHDGAYLTDTMMVLRLDLEQHKVLVISIPRDIWVKIPTTTEEEFYRKINSAYQIGLYRESYPAVPAKYGGEQGASELIKETVGTIVGFSIDNYIALDFNGFKQAVDTLGGIDITVERAFTDPLYPIDGKEADLCGVDVNDLAKFEELEKIATESPEVAYPCRYETLQFAAGTQHMDGATALKFVRSRHSLQDGGDFGRARRQQLFLDAMRAKILSVTFIPKIIPLMNDLENNLRTDLPLELINKFLAESPDRENYTMQQIILTTDNYLSEDYSADGQYILTSRNGQDNWSALHKDIQNTIAGVSPTPSIVVSPTTKLRR